MANVGCPPRSIAMLRQYLDDTQALVQSDGEFSKPFPVTNGVKLAYVMAPTLFRMMFFALLTDAFQGCDESFPIGCPFDGKLFNLRRSQANSKVQTDVPDKLLYSDDMADNAKNGDKMHGSMDRVPKACDNYNLYNQHKKTEVVYQPASVKPYSEPTITVNRHRLYVVEKFIYLGSTLMMRLLPKL